MTRVGFVYPHHGEGWLGGTSYLRNLLTAICAAPDLGMLPVLLARRGTRLVQGLPAMEVVRSRLLGVHAWFDVRHIWTAVERAPILDELLAAERIPLLSHSGPLGTSAKTRTLSWIPDLQHRRLPALFSAAELAARDRLFDVTLRLSDAVVLSSRAALRDVEECYPGHSGKLRVLPFVACSSPVSAVPSREEMERRYGFRGPYLLLPNQYWLHKNHRVVLEALALLEASGRHVLVLSTGSLGDYRSAGHYEELMRRRAALSLDARYRVLGVVPYQDLTALLQYAVAVLNPSRFEGWSTTVEESKSLGKRVLLSDIPVHREQAPERGVYFDPSSPEQLAEAMWDACSTHSPEADALAAAEAAATLPRRRREFAEGYTAIARQVVA